MRCTSLLINQTTVKLVPLSTASTSTEQLKIQLQIFKKKQWLKISLPQQPLTSQNKKIEADPECRTEAEPENKHVQNKMVKLEITEPTASRTSSKTRSSGRSSGRLSGCKIIRKTFVRQHYADTKFKYLGTEFMTQYIFFLFSRSLICQDLWLIRNKISLFRIVIKKYILV